MQQEIYVDLLFLINFSMDYLCLYICASVLKRKIKLSRMLIASSLGGIYSIASLFVNISISISVFFDILICLIMCVIVFFEKSRRLSSTLLCSFLYLGISMMMGGCMTAIFNLLNRIDIPLSLVDEDGISTYLFAVLALISCMISLKSSAIISRQAPIKECILKISLSGKEITLLGFADSGNFVKDPISGKSVIIVETNCLKKLIDVSSFDDFLHGRSSRNDLGITLRLIPIKTASGSSILTAFLPDDIKAETTNKRGKKVSVTIDALIAPSDLKSSTSGYDAIIPAEILKF